MDKEKTIKVLEELKDYVNENWDASEYKKDMDEAEEAINIAVSALEDSKIVGTMMLSGQKYIISKVV